MFTTAELENYINEAAQGYLRESKPLNETITKIATAHGLNRDQIARVVEGSNTEVYVQMMNQTTDKYVQFDNASAEKVAETVFGQEKAAAFDMSDYDEPPTSATPALFEKVAAPVIEEQQPSEMELIKEAYRLSAVSERINDSMFEVDVRFQSNSDRLYDIVKQAYLGGTSFGDIKRAIEVSFDSPVVDRVLTECQEKLAAEIHPSKLNLDIQTTGSVNQNNPLIKQAGLLIKDTQEFLTLRERAAETIEEIEKLAGLPGVGLGEKLLNLGRTAKTYGRSVGRALAGKGVRPKVVKLTETVKAVEKPGAAAVGAGAGAGAPAANTVSKPMSKMQKGLLIGGGGVAAGMGLQSHLEETRRRQAGMPMQLGSGG